MDDKSNILNISVRPTHGTVKMFTVPSVLPQDRREQEVFWVKTLISKLPSFSGISLNICSNKDDSHGNHDVIIKMFDNSEIGVQVTELTSELRRRREANREKYLRKVLELLHKKGVSSEEKVLVQLLFDSSDPEELALEKPERIVSLIECGGLINLPKTIDSGRFYVHLENIGENCFYTPNINNIGIDVDFDQVPRSLETYQKAINYLSEKKANSISPWLLIWSFDFYRDKYSFGEKVLEDIKTSFAKSSFDKIYFIESMNGSGFFDANLELHVIKETDLEG